MIGRGSYYNEMDPFAAAWIRELIKAGEIAPGDVDERSIKDVSPDDLRGYTQCHFFAGISGWAYAARIAGWEDDRPLWTGSCPCQPFSVAGKGAGVDDVRHLWPDFFRLIRACRPPVVMGEQVAGKAGYGWLDGVLSDLAGEDYAGRGVDIPACAVDAPHIRSRLYWVARSNVADAGSRGLWLNGHGSSARAASGGGGEARQQRLRPDAGAEHVVGAVAEPRCERSGGRTGEPGGDVGDGAAAGRDQGPGGSAERDEGGDLVDSSGQRRGEGRPEPELRCGRSTSAGADALGVTQGAAECPGLEGHPGDVAAGGGRAIPGGSAASPDGGVFGCGDVANAHCALRGLGDEQPAGQQPFDEQDPGTGLRAGSRNGTFWSGADWLACHDGKARRTQPGASSMVDGLPVALVDCGGSSPVEVPISLLAHGVPKRVAKWRGFGNAIVPQLAAEVIGALLDAEADEALADEFFA